MYWIDVHTHLDQLAISPEQALSLAEARGVRQVITIGTSHQDHAEVLSLSRRFPKKVYASLGVHPHHGDEFSKETGDFILSVASNPEVVAIGEIGLDYHYNHSSRDRQLQSFNDQMEIAVQTGLPVEVHTRDAEQDTAQVLSHFRGRVQGILHCFTGSLWLAQKALDCGWNISFSGIVTFKNAEDLRQVLRHLPLERIHLETDAPYLAPVPERGQKNAPHFLPHTAQRVAQEKGVSLEQLQAQVLRNSQRMFSKIAPLSDLA